MKVPFVDLKKQYECIRDEVAVALQHVLDNTAFSGGRFVEEFERNFASFCECRFAIGVSSGTSALWLALQALGIGRGDEVITVPNSFFATAEAISLCGAVPVFVDVDPVTYTMDPALLEETITPRTKALVPVHLYGQMADMDPILAVARKHGLSVVEDACQAHGALYKGQKAGSMGDAGCFSFYPGKNLGAYGEAGAIVTSNPDLAGRVRALRDHGQSEKYHHSLLGWNARMDGFQGAILSVKLKYLDQWNRARRANARIYNEQLKIEDMLILPQEANYATHVYHIFALLFEERDALLEALKQKDIYCGIHYPVPIHLQEAYRFLGYEEGSFPIAEKCAGEILSLPMFPELRAEQIEKVVAEIRAFIRHRQIVLAGECE
ncbi:MAG: DegT/DnrJ/EryC1/StrS family aminotransferase [Planctomycetota bacterium]